jgi:hypothetical protein
MLTTDNVNRLVSYLLLPVRLVILCIILLIGLCTILVDSIHNYPNMDTIVQTTVEMVLFYSGVSVHIPQDRGLFGFMDLHQTNKFITVFTHHNPWDVLVLPFAMKRPLTGIINHRFQKYTLLRWWLGKFSCKWLPTPTNDSIISIIDQHLTLRDGRRLIMSVNNNERLESICASGANILPIVIRYIPSQYEITSRWNNLFGTVWKTLLDGHVEVWVQFLLLEPCCYRPYECPMILRKSMAHHLDNLPTTNPPRILPQRLVGFKWEWLALVCLGLLVQGIGESWMGLLTTGGCGYLANKFPTNNTRLLYHLTYRVVQVSLLFSVLSYIMHLISSFFLVLL